MKKRQMVFVIIGLAVYSGFEVFCLLWGLDLLPARRQLIEHVTGTVTSGWFLGWAIESLLVPQRTGDETWFRQPPRRGAMYWVPLVFASDLRVQHWQVALSLICFTGLMVRAVWHIANSSRPQMTEGQ